MKEGMFAGASLLLLTTLGARSGKPRTAPLVYARDGDRYVIFASKGGAPSHPDWYHTLVAHPDVTIEVGDQKLASRATVPEGVARDRLWDAQAAAMPNFAEYQRNTTRRIPVVILEPSA